MKKILALILTLSVIAGALLTCLSVHAADNEGVGYTPIENLTCKSTENLTQELSAAGEGFNGSYAMKLTMANPASSKRSTIYFQGSSRTTLGDGGNFRIEFKIKKAAGSLGKNAALNDGTSDNGFAVGFNSGSNWMWAGYLNDSDLSLTEYRTCSYEIALEKTTAWYQFAFRFYSGNDGVSLLIDDLKIYQIVDEQETLVEFQNGLEKDCDFDLAQYYIFDDTVDEELVYTPISLTTSSYREATNLTPEIVSGGIKNSYALKLTGAASRQSTLYFQPSGTNLFAQGSTYIIELKVKKTAGAVNTNGLTIGINEGGTLYWTKTLSDSELSDEWEYYKWEHTITKTGWQYLAFRFTSGSQAASIMIDDLKVYLADDATKTPLKFEADLDADCDFDAKVEYKLTDNCGEYSLVNNIILVDETDTAVSAFKTACSVPSSVTADILDGDTVMGDSVLIKTGAILSATIEGNNSTYAVAVANDVRPDGKFDIADVVKTYRITKGDGATEPQLLAAGAVNGNVGAAELNLIKTALLNK